MGKNKIRLTSEGFGGRKVLITGHTGFKGSWLTAWLKLLGANIVGVSLDPPTIPSHFLEANLDNGISDNRVDIRNYSELEEVIIATQPDYVFHLAAQALVRRSYEDPRETWETNLGGTINLLEALRKLDKPCAAVIITSDKCYDNVEWVWGYRETDMLGGADPYSASKGAAELAIKSYVKSYFPHQSSRVRVASARAGNVIGGGDWALDRIVPDCVKSWSLGEIVKLRNPNATRPWQHVLEPLSGYLSLAYGLFNKSELHGHAFNFGPLAQQNRSVLDLVREMGNHWDQVQWEDVSSSGDRLYESGLLKLNCDKALQYLGWHAAMSFEDTVGMTSEWYKVFYQNPERILMVTNSQIDSYVNIAKEKKIHWPWI